ncbi:NAD(P)/FAD-dependent oxidoreductase [Arenibacter sp. BSSL-BM3]|uniref:NAD(P)/FAD-dependent oxidoreductase n=1 Tax=Arenibacter arenosicollis TaxID=2762274 RepID=A0ABR7QPY9_9FLAO|nr:NAD(P)/FAD-dependent oxidoreductase [Arenibacter arenosicollis]MBC8769272.1 NAD(P)/FAD-dependent oxidoreductase [Arenibacter arenosicollis]
MRETQNVTKLETDYLIVGSGAVGMAFADVILSETDANMIIVDKFHKPGGHWNLAYSFVKLHQPSAYYGVSSEDLGKDDTDKVGVNKGLRHLSSGAEISAYYDDVMQRKFLPSGRVKYFPLCEYQGENKFVSTLTGRSYTVKVNKKNVNAAHMQTKVPSTHTPNFSISPEVQFIAINDLPKVGKPPAGWIVIGGGKTGVDAIIWLLEHQVDPAKITWIVPRDSWYTDRKNIQPSEEFLKYFLNDQLAQLKALEQAESVTDLFDKLEKSGVLLRIDKKVRPKMHRGATISQLELKQLRRVKNIVRMGRIKRIEKDGIILERGRIDNDPNHIFVDCSANALAHLDNTPIFSGNTITLQPVRGGQIVFSAAFIAHVEADYKEEIQKNKLCGVVPLPNHDTDWIKMFAGSMKNQHNWKKDPELTKWLYNNRLDGFSHLVANISEKDEEMQAILKRLRNSIKPAMINLETLLS